jgi:hypothetical protein
MTGKSNTAPTEHDFDWRSLIGFADHQRRLADLQQRGELPQVVLFEGREGLGKRLLLAWLASLWHCDARNACGVCASCLQIRHASHPEILWLETDQSFKLEAAQRFQEFLDLQAAAGPRSRIVVVVDCEKMTERVANRLLKTLEEPGEHAQILLSTSRPRQLLPTILSRTVRWHLPPPDPQLTLDWLAERLAGVEGGTPDETLWQRLLKINGLSPGATLLAIEGAADGAAQRLDEALVGILFSPHTGQGLQQALHLGREQGRSVIDLANHFELLLNRYYKWCLGLGSQEDRDLFHKFSSQPSFKQVNHWRTLLRQVRAVATRGRVPLNAQLMLENLALAERSS